MDKITRVLILYSKLRKGKIVNKESFCVEYETTKRSFDRDIEDIRLFLSETYSGHELKYDRQKNGYLINGLSANKELEAMEVVLLLTLLSSSRSLRADEFEVLTKNIVDASERWKKKELKEIAQNICEKYNAVNHNQALLKLFWDLHMCIHDRNVIVLKYIKRTGEYVQRRVIPLEIIFSEHYFYLIGMIQNEDYEYPAFYRLDRVDSFAITSELYDKNIKEKYKGLHLYKKLQYMQGGKIDSITVKCEKDAKDNLLDVFYDSRVIEENNELSVIQVEATKESFVQWVLSQKEKVIVLEPIEIRREICEILNKTLKEYEEKGEVKDENV